MRIMMRSRLTIKFTLGIQGFGKVTDISHVNRKKLLSIANANKKRQAIICLNNQSFVKIVELLMYQVRFCYLCYAHVSRICTWKATLMCSFFLLTCRFYESDDLHT